MVAYCGTEWQESFKQEIFQAPLANSALRAASDKNGYCVYMGICVFNPAEGRFAARIDAKSGERYTPGSLFLCCQIISANVYTVNDFAQPHIPSPFFRKRRLSKKEIRL